MHIESDTYHPTVSHSPTALICSFRYLGRARKRDPAARKPLEHDPAYKKEQYVRNKYERGLWLNTEFSFLDAQELAQKPFDGTGDREAVSKNRSFATSGAAPRSRTGALSSSPSRHLVRSQATTSHSTRGRDRPKSTGQRSQAAWEPFSGAIIDEAIPASFARQALSPNVTNTLMSTVAASAKPSRSLCQDDPDFFFAEFGL